MNNPLRFTDPLGLDNCDGVNETVYNGNCPLPLPSQANTLPQGDQGGSGGTTLNRATGEDSGDIDITLDMINNARALAPAFNRGAAQVNMFAAAATVQAGVAAAVVAGPTVAGMVGQRVLLGPALNRAFWSGAGYFLASSAPSVTVLDETPVGKVLSVLTNDAGEGFGFNYSTMSPFWNMASEQFARGASGPVVMYTGLDGYLGPTFLNYELPQLSGLPITYVEP